MAEAVAGAVAGGGIAQAIQQVLHQVASFVKTVVVQVARTGRQVLRISYEIAREIAKPEVGVPFSLLLYNTSKLIRQNRDATVNAVRSYFESIKQIDVVGTVWTRVRDWISGFLYLSPPTHYWDLFNPFTVWNMINNSPWAPTWQISFLGATIDLSAIPRVFIFLGLYPVFVIIAINIGFLDLLWRLAQVFISVIEFIAVAVAGFAIDLVNFVSDVMSFLACSYLKIIQPVIPLYIGAKEAGRGFSKALRASLVGTMFSWIAIYMFAPECSYIQIPTVSLAPPQLTAPTAPTLQSLPPYIMISKDIKASIIIDPRAMVEKTIDKSARPQFFWVVYRVAEQVVSKSIDKSILYEVTTTLPSIEKSITPSVEYSIVAPVEQIVDKQVAVSVEYTVISQPEQVISKSIAKSIAYQLLDTYLQTQLQTVQLSALVKVSDVTADTLYVTKPITAYVKTIDVSSSLMVNQFSVNIKQSDVSSSFQVTQFSVNITTGS